MLSDVFNHFPCNHFLYTVDTGFISISHIQIIFAFSKLHLIFIEVQSLGPSYPGFSPFYNVIKLLLLFFK